MGTFDKASDECDNNLLTPDLCSSDGTSTAVVETLKALISEAERNGIEHLKHVWTGMRRYNETHFSYYNKNGTVVWATFPDLGFEIITYFI